MAEIIKLRTARKQAKKTTDETRAAQNRALHGRSRAEKNLEIARHEKAQHELDSHRLVREDC